MNTTEYEQTITLVIATAEIMGTEIKPAVAVMMADDLSEYPFADVKHALTRVRRECSGKLTLKMILEVHKPADGWLSANEAWATALPAMDEAATVVWTPETAKAFEVARPLLEEGDKIGARMAFIPAYERIVDQAKRENRAPTYEVSAGWDVNMRNIAVQTAVSAGLLPPPKQDPLMLAPPDETPEQRRAREAEEEANREEMRNRLADLAKQLRSGGNTELERREEERKRLAAEHEARKAEMIKQLQEKQGERNEANPL